MQDGTLAYPSDNAAWIGQVRYHLLIGKPHRTTVAISRMHAEDQDVIDDFLIKMAKAWRQDLERVMKGLG